MEGGSLADLLDASPALSLTETVRLLGPVADALDTAHAAGLVHRDVKPGNILLQGDRAYLADFGLAVTETPEDGQDDDRSSAADLALSGTTAYLAPERIEGDEATGAADQYALGCVAFECLTGIRPLPGRTSWPWSTPTCASLRRVRPRSGRSCRRPRMRCWLGRWRRIGRIDSGRAGSSSTRSRRPRHRQRSAASGRPGATLAKGWGRRDPVGRRCSCRGGGSSVRRQSGPSDSRRQPVSRRRCSHP